MSAVDVAGRLGVRFPVIQGPFGGGLSTARLTAAVSNLGGLGSFGANVLSPEAIERTARELRALTSAPFALNLWVSNEDPGGLDFDQADFDRAVRVVEPYFRELGLEPPRMPTPPEVGYRFEEQIDALLESRPPVFSFVFGIPSRQVLEACRVRGMITIGAATSLREAQALEAAGVELIVATGFEAGGHRPSFLDRAEDSLMGTFVLTQLVSAGVKPGVIAAGGIVDGRGLRAARALGASAVQVGTAFLACEESGARDEHRALLLGERARTTTLSRSFTGRLARSIANRWTQEMGNRPFAPYPLQGFLMAQLKRGLLARERPVAELSSLWSSQAAPLLRHRTAADVLDALLDGLDRH